MSFPSRFRSLVAAFSYNIEPDGLAVVVGTGEGDRQAWLATIFKLMSDQRFGEHAPILMDFTALTSAPPPIYGSALADDVQGVLRRNRIAVIATPPAVFALTSQVSLLTGERISAFQPLDEGRDWLRKSTAEN